MAEWGVRSALLNVRSRKTAAERGIGEIGCEVKSHCSWVVSQSLFVESLFSGAIPCRVLRETAVGERERARCFSIEEGVGF